MARTARKKKAFTTMKPLYNKKNEPMKVAGFMSGKGSNLRKILAAANSSFKVVMIFSDSSGSKAKEIAKEHSINYYCNDIKEYYKSRGHSDRTDLRVRKEYDKEIAKLLKKHDVEVVALCGYMSVVSDVICDNYLTLNVHPADLRMLDSNGKRLYAGCIGIGCVKKVIASGGKELRSSTHLVTSEVDGGAILMVSKPIKIENDPEKSFEKLKEHGDWKIYPETIKKIAEGKFYMDEEGFVVDVVEEKELMREKMKKFRERFSNDEVASKSEAIARRLFQLEEYVQTKTVMFYMGVNKEVQTEAIVNRALTSKKVVVPITDLDNRKILTSQIESLDDLRPGAYGILEPGEKKEINSEEIDMVIVPGLAFDEQGNRLGYGLGFYDKFLEKFRGTKIALAYELQIVDKVRTTNEDIKVDKIITEERVIDCKR